MEQNSCALEEDWVFLLIDASNSFNSANRYHMLWAVRHEWPTGFQSVYICYKHWSQLVIRDTSTDQIIIIPIREGVTQGDPLAMIFYGLSTLSLTRELDESDSDWKQIWYVDDAGILGMFSGILRIYQKLQMIGPQWGYHPDPWKRILVVNPTGQERSEFLFGTYGFKIQKGS